MKRTCLVVIIIASALATIVNAQQIKVLYFNDAHELDPVEFGNQEVGGIAKLSHLIDQRRDANTIVIFGGDLGGGTLGGKVFKGSVMIKAFNQIKIDVANPGQHEFDYGLKNFIQLKENSAFPWISTNLYNPKDSSLFIPFWSTELDKMKVGVIGLTDKLETSRPGLGLIERDMIESARAIIQNNTNIDYWIAVSQMDIEKNELLQLKIPHLDLILTEETYQDRTQIVWNKETPIIAASGNAGDLVEVVYNGIDTKVQVHAIRKGDVEDLKMKQWISDSIQVMNDRLSKKVAFAIKSFPKEEDKLGERAIGNLITDAFKSYYDADIAIINGGGIRSGLPKGDITLKNIYEVLPYENDLVLVQLTGQDIKGILNKSLGRLMPQISGMKIEIVGEKDHRYINKIYFNNIPIELAEDYTVALPSYIADGGGEYTKIDSTKILRRDIKDSEALNAYLIQNPFVKPVIEHKIINK